eukprot:3227785-Rhodomonas_salina.4
MAHLLAARRLTLKASPPQTMLDVGRQTLPISRLGLRLVSRASFSSSAHRDGASKWDIPKCEANYTQLSPLSWLKRCSRGRAFGYSWVEGIHVEGDCRPVRKTCECSHERGGQAGRYW